MLAILFSIFLLSNPVMNEESKVEWLSATTHDFGDLKQDVPVTVDFVFKNIGQDSLSIDNVRTSCGCTAPDWSEDLVPPDGESAIHIEFEAKNPGFFEKKIVVYFSNQRKGEKLFITGYVE